jgi:putative flippase GtrA
MILKLLKFGVVGFSGLIIDFSVTYILKEFLKINRYISNSIGFVIAASSNYLLNRIWTFQSTNPEIMVEYGSFLLVSVIGLALNTVLLYYIHSRTKLNFYVSKAFAMGIVTAWNFLANAFITFNPDKLTAVLF